MTTSQSSNEQSAWGQLRIALQRLAGRYPFHARVIERFKERCEPCINTMAVRAREENIELLFHPGFVLGITLDELTGVLLHEVHHVVFGHVVADPNDFPDEQARIVAEETTVNEFIKEPLPGDPVTLDHYPQLPPLESTRERYQRLADEAAAARTGKSAGAGDDAANVQTLDDHSTWQQCGDARRRTEGFLLTVVKDAAIEAGAEAIPDYLKGLIRRMGCEPGVSESQLVTQGRGNVNWPQQLRRYVGQVVRPSPDFLRPPRRFPQLVGVVPGRRRRGGQPQVMAVIDTSGSLTDDLLMLISSELARMSKDFDVTVVECDAQIHDVYGYRPVTSVRGRGGTDLRPPFENGFLRQHRPDLIVYFTDGFGPAPDANPRIPVIWCLTPDGEPPVQWGRVIRMTTDG